MAICSRGEATVADTVGVSHIKPSVSAPEDLIAGPLFEVC